MHIDLQELLMEYCDANPEGIQKKNLSGCVLTITQLRDKLYLIGKYCMKIWKIKYTLHQFVLESPI